MPSRVLIIFPGALGDLVLLAPAMAAIARAHRDADLELMARYELAEFAVGRLGIARAHSIDRREVTLLFRESEDGDEAQPFFNAFERIYCFFNAEDPNFSKRLAKCCTRGEVTFHRFRPHSHEHVAVAYLKEVFGHEAKLPAPSISLLSEDKNAAEHATSGLVEPGRFVAIFPGSGSPRKNWPIQKYVALADSLNDTSRALFILGPAEEAVAKLLRARGHDFVAGQLLGTVAAIAQMAAAFVGNDSGVSHLANIAGARGIVLFGPTDPGRWCPLGNVTILRGDPIDRIEVQEVIRALWRGVPFPSR